MFRVNNFDKLLDKATSNLRLDPDWPTILQICDLIRQNDCTPKYAVSGIKKKLYSTNPHQAMFALLTLESIVKNCGSGIHDEVASKAFCEMLRDLVKTTQHENLRTKILELIQAWAFAFRNNQKYRAVQDTVNILKAEGYKFPTLKESDAMFSADTAPEWADGEVCHRCRVQFSLMVRRHHCRACGQVFCQQCSSKTSTLPKFGIEKEVRVCDACYDKVSRPPSSAAKLEIIDTSNDYGPTQPQKRPSGGKTAEELQEEEELQLALALSQSEAEQKEKERTRTRLHHIAPDPTPQLTISPTPSSVSASPEHSSTNNAELSRYLDRNYWEQKLLRDSAAPTAPSSHGTSEASESQLEYTKPSSSNKASEDDSEDKEIDEFVESLKSQVEIFVNRMKSNSSRGRSIANDTSVQTLFMNITAMHSRLLRYIQQQDDKRTYLESLQDKVNQVRDSRAALDTLRAEHAARLAAQAEAAERQRQMQMAAKLQAMRKKKHEYLQYQRQLALQRVQEQEREMQMRQEQQKHQYMMSAGSYYLPGMPMQYQPPYPQANQQGPAYPNPQMVPQMHQMMPQDSIPMMSQMGTISQSMPQMPNTYTTAGMNINQAPSQSMAQNMRPVTQQMSMPPMMVQQMHQMRLGQPGVHQMMPNVANGQQNGQVNQQLPKQNLPNQPMTSVPQSVVQTIMNPSNPMLNMPIQNMRMPVMQGNQPGNQQMPGYGQQQNTMPNMQQQLPGQPISLPNQQMMASQPMPGQTPAMNPQTSQSMQMPTQVPQNLAQGQPMPPPQQMMIQNQPMLQNQNIPQNQSVSQGQQLSGQLQQGTQMPPGQMQAPMPQGPHVQQMPPPQPMQGQMGQPMPQGHGQPMPQGQQMPQGQPMQQNQIPQGQSMQQNQLPQGQPMPQNQLPQGQPIQQNQIPQGQPMPQGQTMPQGQPMPQGQQIPQTQPANMVNQQMKIPSQNFVQQQPGNPNQQSQQAQTPVKSEHNNNTAELISFD